MKSILVIAEPSNKLQIALDKAVSFAKLSGAKIHVAINYYEKNGWESAEVTEQRKSKRIAEEEGWWRSYIESLNTDIVITHQLLWEKYLVDWILKQCRSQPYDLIIKEGHRTETVVHTSTDWLLLRESPVPVYVVTPIHNRESNTLLVALDLMTSSPEKQHLNQRLLEEGFRLSVATNSQMHVCYVVSVVPALSDMDIVDPNSILQEVKPIAMEKCKELTAQYDVAENQMHIVKGEPNKAISSLASRIAANCIVIGSMGRKGIIGKFFGNTSEQVIKLAHKDLLVLGTE